MAKRSECYENKKYEAKDEDELQRSIDEDPDKLKGWEGPIEVHLRSVRYPERKAKGKGRAPKLSLQIMRKYKRNI